MRDDGTSGDGVVSKQTGEEETDVHAENAVDCALGCWCRGGGVLRVERVESDCGGETKDGGARTVV